MTTSKGIILLLLEQNSVPLLAPGWLFVFFFPKNWLELEVHSPFVALDWGRFGSWGSWSRPESQVHLFNDGIVTILEFQSGKYGFG